MAVADSYNQLRDTLDPTVRSPLRALRISSLSKLDRLANNHGTPKVHRNNSRKRQRAKIESAKSRASAGFDFDISIDNGEKEAALEEDPEEESDSASNAKRLAVFLLNSGRTMNSRFNVVDGLALLDGNIEEGPRPHISRSARNRTEPVKAILSLKYHWMERSIEWHSTEVNVHPGVEGVYNPLQIIRNRAIRAKYHEHPPPTMFKNLPLACNAFSKNSTAARPWKMLWGVEMNEFVNDNSWRTYHWNELQNPHGKPWFPDLNSNSSLSLSPQKSKGLRRLHDKLWSDEDDEQVPVIVVNSNRSKSPAALRIKKNIKQRAKRLYGNNSSATSASEVEPVEFSGNEQLKSSESLVKLLAKAEGADPPILAEKPEFVHVEESAPKLSDTVKPIIRIVTDGSEPSATKSSDELLNSLLPQNGLTYTPLHSRANLDRMDMPISLNIDLVVDMGSQSSADQLVTLGAKESYLEKLIFLNINYLSSIFPTLRESTSTTVDTILTKDINELLHSIVKVSDYQLPAHEAFYSGFLNESKSLMHMANDNYAVKIDNLLSATDRSIGEINTSLSLDLRKVNEQVDRINRSLFGNIVSDTLQESKELRFTDGANYRVLYILLENAIVVVLRIIWIVATVYKFFLCILKLMWKIVSFLFI